eukprot:5430305-Prymnesium_polylepis.3
MRLIPWTSSAAADPFASLPSPVVTGRARPALVDVNLDGKLDLIVRWCARTPQYMNVRVPAKRSAH